MATVAEARASRATIRKFYLFSFFEGFAPIYPVYMIMFEGRGYDLTALSLLLSIWALPVVLLELPSGILADRWSKKRVVALGMLFKALCFVLWAASPSFAAAAVGFVLWGCQEAFCSGARQALLYEALQDKGRADAYAGTVGVSGAVELVSIAVSMVAGAAIYAASPLLALGLSALSSVAAAITARSFKERRIEAPSRSSPASLLAELKSYGGERALAVLLAAACLARAAYDTVDEFDGLWAADRYAVPVAWVGVWGALRMAAQGLGGLSAGFFSRTLGGGRLGGFLAFVGAFFGASAFLPGLWGIPPYFSFYFFLEAVSVMFEARLQEFAADSTRASLLSVSSLLMTAIAIVIAPALGAAGEAGGLGWIVAICGGLTVVSGTILLVFQKRSYYS